MTDHTETVFAAMKPGREYTAADMVNRTKLTAGEVRSALYRLTTANRVVSDRIGTGQTSAQAYRRLA